MASCLMVSEGKDTAETFIEKLKEDTNAERMEWVSCGDDVYDIPDVRLMHAGLLKLAKEGILYTGRACEQEACAQGDVRILNGSIAVSLDFYEGKDLVVIPHRSASARTAADDARDFDYFLIWDDEAGSHKTLLLTTSGDGTRALRRLTKELYGIIFDLEETG